MVRIKQVTYVVLYMYINKYSLYIHTINVFHARSMNLMDQLSVGIDLQKRGPTHRGKQSIYGTKHQKNN